METAGDSLTQAREKLWNYCRSQKIRFFGKDVSLSAFFSKETIDNLLSYNDQGKIVMDMHALVSVPLQYTIQRPNIRKQLMVRMLGYGFQESFLSDPADIRHFAQQHGVYIRPSDYFPSMQSMAFSAKMQGPALQFHRKIPPSPKAPVATINEPPPTELLTVTTEAESPTRTVYVRDFKPLPPFAPRPSKTCFRDRITTHLRVLPDSDITRLFSTTQPTLVKLTHILYYKDIFTVGDLANMQATEFEQVAPRLLTHKQATALIRYAGMACGKASDTTNTMPLDLRHFAEEIKEPLEKTMRTPAYRKAAKYVNEHMDEFPHTHRVHHRRTDHRKGAER